MKKVLIIGSGYMAQEYAKVLIAQNVEFEIIGNRSEKISDFLKLYPKTKCYSGGYEKFLQENLIDASRKIIVASSVDTLYSATVAFMHRGAKTILVEKPAGLSLAEIHELYELAIKYSVNLSIAYNRRFYKSVSLAKDIIESDGGISSIHFEFTEWVHTIDEEKFPPHVLSKFIIANSTHVIDTVFYLAGKPKVLNCFVGGDAVKWHPSGSLFVGSGVTVKDIPFSYHTNWEAPGRWSIEIMTQKHRLYLKPMERLAIQEKGSIQVQELDADYSIDIEYKPGLYNQVKAFLNNDQTCVCTIDELLFFFPFYCEISGY